MADINAGIMSAIDDYLNLSVSPRFVLLVVGEWGSGKTHLVRRILEEQNDSARKVLSVSLYGLNRTSQIDKIIFQQLHPILGSEKLRFAGRVLANVLSATIPISLPFETTAEVDLGKL